MGWMPSFPTFDRNPLELADEARRRRASTRPSTSSPSSRPAGCGFAVDDPSAPSSFPRVFFVWRSNLLGSSGKGQEYFLRHLLGADARRAAGRAAARGRAPVERALARGDPARQARPAGQRRLPHDDDRPVLRRRAAGGDLVREVRPVDDRHAPVRAFVQPGGAAAVGGAHRLGHVRHDRARVLARWPPSTSACAATSSPRPVLHDTPGEIAQPRGEVADWRAGECEPVPGRTMPNLTVVERDYGAVAEQWAALGPAGRAARRDASRARRGSRTARCEWLARAQRARARRRRRRAAVAGARRAGRRGDARALGRHQRAPRASPASARWRSAAACRSPTWPRAPRRRGSPSRTRRCSRGG